MPIYTLIEFICDPTCYFYFQPAINQSNSNHGSLSAIVKTQGGEAQVCWGTQSTSITFISYSLQRPRQMMKQPLQFYSAVSGGHLDQWLADCKQSWGTHGPLQAYRRGRSSPSGLCSGCNCPRTPSPLCFRGRFGSPVTHQQENQSYVKDDNSRRQVKSNFVSAYSWQSFKFLNSICQKDSRKKRKEKELLLIKNQFILSIVR